MFIDAGSRYEDASIRGVSHIMDRLAFRSTQRHTSDQMMERIEMLGGNVQCASSRESMMYQAATFNSSVNDALALIAETVREPRITGKEITSEIETATYELKEIWAKPEMILPELVHMAAFRDNTLGNPLLCPKERLWFIGADEIQRYRDMFYRPERMVVAFAGVEHDQAIKMTERLFGDMPKSEGPILSRTGSESSLDSFSTIPSEVSDTQWSQISAASSISLKSTQSSLLSKVPFFKSLSTSAPSHASVAEPASSTSETDIFAPARYTGGYMTLPPQAKSQKLSQPVFSHIHVAFEGLPIKSADIYALATLQFLLGGGGSFSAGGPGKGMYSRLYTNVLNQHGWVESCLAFNHTYTDSGLFGISGSCLPGRTSSMLDVVCRELKNLTLDSGYSALQQQEVSRAKHQLRSSLLMNLESRMVELEDLGRQVQIHGRKVPVKEMCEKIEELTIGDLRRVAKKILGSGPPTVVVQGVEGDSRDLGIGWDHIQGVISGWGLGKN